MTISRSYWCLRTSIAHTSSRFTSLFLRFGRIPPQHVYDITYEQFSAENPLELSGPEALSVPEHAQRGILQYERSALLNDATLSKDANLSFFNPPGPAQPVHNHRYR